MGFNILGLAGPEKEATMRNFTTDIMGINLTDDFRLSGQTPEEFLSSFDDMLGTVRVSTFTDFSGVEVVETMANLVDEGTIYTVYHHSDRNEFFVKI